MTTIVSSLDFRYGMKPTTLRGSGRRRSRSVTEDIKDDGEEHACDATILYVPMPPAQSINGAVRRIFPSHIVVIQLNTLIALGTAWRWKPP